MLSWISLRFIISEGHLIFSCEITWLENIDGTTENDTVRGEEQRHEILEEWQNARAHKNRKALYELKGL